VSEPAGSAFGRELRRWRGLRGASQLRLATEAGISARHLSFMETGRSRPSRAMVLRLAEALDVPLRERNVLLAAAGFASVYRESALDAPEMEPVVRMLHFLLERHEPFPAYLVDACWRVHRANAAAERMRGHLAGPHPVWRETPLNLLRLTLHPEGLRPYLLNWSPPPSWRAWSARSPSRAAIRSSRRCSRSSAPSPACRSPDPRPSPVRRRSRCCPST